MRYAFEGCVLDTQRYVLHRANQSTVLRPKVFQVLQHLIAHRDRVISKTELAEQLWADQFVSDAVLESTIRAVRQAIGDGGRKQRCIQTLRGHGYRFVADVEIEVGAVAVQQEEVLPPSPRDAGELSRRVIDPSPSPSFNPLQPMALHQLPPSPRDFTGRTAELAELLDACIQQGLTIVGLQGMGGLGKTTLGLKLAEQLLPYYPDAQLYVDLKGTHAQPLSTSEVMTHVIQAYYPQATLPENEAALSGLYQSVLYDQHAILFMDDAANAEQIRPLVPPSSCLLIVTSRQHFTLPGLYAKQLSTLLPADALELLLAITPRVECHAERLSQLCGYLPLALRVTADALAVRTDLDPSAYFQQLSEAQERLKLTGVQASLNLSADLLPPALRQQWYALALFPDTFDEQSASAVWDLELGRPKQPIGLAHFLDLRPSPNAIWAFQCDMTGQKLGKEFGQKTAFLDSLT